MQVRKSILGAVFLCSLVVAFASPAWSAAVLADLENALMCKCDDKCGKVLINCTCSTSDKTRAKFAKMLESGLTVDQIIQAQIEEHGETVLSAPSKYGFNLTAWITPFGALLIGGYGIRRVLRTWVSKSGQASETNIEEEDTSLPSRYSSRLRDELDNIEI